MADIAHARDDEEPEAERVNRVGLWFVLGLVRRIGTERCDAT